MHSLNQSIIAHPTEGSIYTIEVSWFHIVHIKSKQAQKVARWRLARWLGNLINLYHASLLHVEILAEVFICWNLSHLTYTCSPKLKQLCFRDNALCWMSVVPDLPCMSPLYSRWPWNFDWFIELNLVQHISWYRLDTHMMSRAGQVTFNPHILDHKPEGWILMGRVLHLVHIPHWFLYKPSMQFTLDDLHPCGFQFSHDQSPIPL